LCVATAAILLLLLAPSMLLLIIQYRTPFLTPDNKRPLDGLTTQGGRSRVESFRVGSHRTPARTNDVGLPEEARPRKAVGPDDATEPRHHDAPPPMPTTPRCYWASLYGARFLRLINRPSHRVRINCCQPVGWSVAHTNFNSVSTSDQRSRYCIDRRAISIRVM